MTKPHLLFAALIAVAGLVAEASAVPMQLAHQGRLFGADNEPVEGTHTLSFNLYDASAGGALLWGEDLLVDFSGGYYAVVLGDNPANPIDSAVFDGPTVYLGMAVDDADELAPRHQVVSAPYAILADTASFVPWSGVEGKPPGFADDIDNDLLAGVSCSDGATLEWSDATATWVCGADNDTTYSGADFALSNQLCPDGQVVRGVDASGNAICVLDLDTDTDTNTTYTGDDFALSNQSCPAGQVVSGVDASGTAICVPDADTDTDTNTTYTGDDFALSNQSCPAGQVVGGIDASGIAICVLDADTDTDTNTTYTGDDFALSNQTCPANQFMTGISASGTPLCSGLPSTVLQDYVNTNCYVYFGWRDNCNNCSSAPVKGGRARGLPSECATFGADNTCQTVSMFGQTVRIAGVNTDGSVNGDDKFYIGLKCQ